MRLLYPIFFGAGVAAFVYSRFARRVGYGNTKSVVILLAVIFVISAIVFATIFSLLNVK